MRCRRLVGPINQRFAGVRVQTLLVISLARYVLRRVTSARARCRRGETAGHGRMTDMQRFLDGRLAVGSRGGLRLAYAGRSCRCRRLSDTAAAHHCRLPGRRLDRHLCAPVRRLAQQTARPAVHRREPSRRRQQSRDRSRRQGAARRLHDPSGQPGQHDQRIALQAPQFQFPA